MTGFCTGKYFSTCMLHLQTSWAFKRSSYYFAPYQILWEQNHPHKWGHIRRFFDPMFANCVNNKTMLVHFSDREIYFFPNCCKFDVECVWNIKNSQNVQNFLKYRWVYFGKKFRNFSKSLNVAKFFQNASQMVLFLKNVFPS